MYYTYNIDHFKGNISLKLYKNHPTFQYAMLNCDVIEYKRATHMLIPWG